MMISKERVEELKNRLLIQLRSEFEEIYHDVQAELEEDPIEFLFDYMKYLKRDTRASIGNISSNSYVYIDFPLSRWDFSIGNISSNSYVYIDFPLSQWDFTEEELKYFKFYDEPNNHRRLPKEY